MNPLEQAAELLEQGWCSGGLYNDGKYCALGALAQVELDLDLRLAEYGEWEADKHKEQNSELYWKAVAYVADVYEQIEKTRSARVLAEQIYEDMGSDPADLKDIDDDEIAGIIWSYNDSKSKEQVLETFKYAAKRYDS